MLEFMQAIQALTAAMAHDIATMKQLVESNRELLQAIRERVAIETDERDTESRLLS